MVSPAFSTVSEEIDNSSLPLFLIPIMLILNFLRISSSPIEWSDINGLISSINQFIVYFNLVEAGLSSAAVYSLYKPIAEHNYNQINRVVVAARNFYVKSGFIFFLSIANYIIIHVPL